MGIFSNLFIKKTSEAKKPKTLAQSSINSNSKSKRFYGQKFDGGLPFQRGLNLDHAETRQQVRRLSHESLQLRAILERDVDTVIGQGLNLIPEPRYSVLGITPEQANEWKSDVKAKFELWANSVKANRSGRFNFFQAQRLMQKCLKRDGELFIALSYHNDKNLISPLRFEILDPDQIREQGFTSTFTGRGDGLASSEGITRNSDGEEISYKVWRRNSRGMQELTEIPKIGRSGRLMMLHAITGIDYAGQQRGLSPFHSSIQDFENILNFTLAQIMKAIKQSNIVFSVESNSDEDADDPFKNEGAESGPIEKKIKELESKKENNDDENTEKEKEKEEEQPIPQYNSLSHTDFTTPGSTGVFSLKSKQQLKSFMDSAPSDKYDEFVRANFKYICAAIGKSAEEVLFDLNSNYSAARATLIMAYRAAERERWEWDFYIGSPIYEMWLSEEIAAGRVSAPGFSNPLMRAAWAAHRYQGSGMPILDPVKTLTEFKMASEMSLISLSEAAQIYNDSDFEANVIALTQEMEMLPAPAWGWTNAKGGSANNAETEDDEDENKEKDLTIEKRG